jgi:hypothetical protein
MNVPIVALPDVKVGDWILIDSSAVIAKRKAQAGEN